MRAVEFVIVGAWALFWTYWLLAARHRRRGHLPWSVEIGVRCALFAVVVVLVRLGAFDDHRLQHNPLLAAVGLLMVGAGLGLAVRARRHLGRQWALPMTRADHPALVTSGPYRRVRHPIYSGILLAGTGSATALNPRWLTAVLVAGIYFLVSAVVEERALLAALPEAYREYQRTTQMLIPYLL